MVGSLDSGRKFLSAWVVGDDILTWTPSGFGLTSLSTGFVPIAAGFNVSTTTSILAYCIYLFGVAFAPIYSPHVAGKSIRLEFFILGLADNK